MADTSKIEWTDATWNPVTGCTKVSAGCKHCYAERDWPRLANLPAYKGRAFTDVAFHTDRLAQPLHWQKPRRIFVNSMSDLFHPEVPDEFLDKVFAVMALCPQHVFQILTKRPERMRDYLRALGEAAATEQDERITRATNAVLLGAGLSWAKCGATSTNITTLSRGTGAREPYLLRKTASGEIERLVSWKDGEQWRTLPEEFAVRVRDFLPEGEFGWGLKGWPLPNVWIGVSVENQETADERIPLLLETPAAVRWISAEPLLGPVDLSAEWLAVKCGGRYPFKGLPDEYRTKLVDLLDWVVVGGESGTKARPMHPDWVRSLRDQCAAADVQFMFKQWGEYRPDYDRDREDPDWRRCSLVERECQPGRWMNLAGGHGFNGDRVHWMSKVGKKIAGRLLDGQLHDGYPGAPA